MTSKLVVNTIEADTGISSVSFGSSISLSSTSKFFFGAAGIDIGADTNINRPAAGVLGFNINSSEKFRVDSSGHIKAVGVCTATHFYGDGSNLTGITGTTINNNADNRVITGSGTANTLNGEANLTFNSSLVVTDGNGTVTTGGNYINLKRTSATVNYINAPLADAELHISADENIVFKTVHTGDFNSTERLRIDSSGNMNFQNSSTSATTALSSIIFNNGVGEVARIRSHTRNGNTNGMITFHTDISGSSSEKMRVNHDGGFCFGTDSSRTAEFSQPDGFSIRFDDKGQFQNSVSNTTGGYMNRKGSDGGILSFARQGVYKGEIGVNASTIYLNFGGTNAAAHQLDDYEQGTWTPNMFGNGSGSYTTRNGYFTKIGDTVNIYFYIDVTNANAGGGNQFLMYGLPFTSTGRATGSFMSKYHTTNNNRWFVLYIDTNSSHIQSYGSEANANWEALGADGTFEMIGQITYRTNS